MEKWSSTYVILRKRHYYIQFCATKKQGRLISSKEAHPHTSNYLGVEEPGGRRREAKSRGCCSTTWAGARTAARTACSHPASQHSIACLLFQCPYSMFQTDITQTGCWKGLRNQGAIQVNDLIQENDTVDWREDEEQSTGVHIWT